MSQAAARVLVRRAMGRRQTVTQARRGLSGFVMKASRPRRGIAPWKEPANQIFSSQLFANQNRDARETFFATMAAQLAARLCLFNTSVPIPKFVSTCGPLVRTSESIRTLAKLFLLVPLLNPKLASVNSGSLCELRVRSTSRQSVDKYYPPPNARWRRRAWRSR